MELKKYVQNTLEAVGSGVTAARFPNHQGEQAITVEFDVQASAGGANFEDIVVEAQNPGNRLGQLKFSVQVWIAERRPTTT